MRTALLTLLLCNAASATWLAKVLENGRRLEAKREWDRAEAAYKAALIECELRDCHHERFWLQTSLAEMAFNQSDYVRSERWLKAAEDYLRKRPANDPDRIRLLSAKAALHLVEGRLTAAERDLSAAAAIARRNEASFFLAGILHNLASVEMQTGRLDEAHDHQQQALSLFTSEFGERHEYVMRAWISLSTIQALRTDWRAAEQSLRHALAIRETPEALGNYAVVLEHLKRGRQAREIRKRIAPPLPPKALIDASALPYERDRLQVVTR
jgi:tetratricopeptide (TPR) repeat protein